MTIELHLLGGFGASVDGVPIPALRSGASARLLSYLAMHRTTRPRRTYLASTFWPDGSESRARRRLSHTLWELQSALADVDPALVQADRDTIGLSDTTELWVDADVFERLVDSFELRRREGNAGLHSESLSRAIDLYHGDLLSDHYDEWIDPIRVRLREKYLLGLRHLVQLQKGRGEYHDAIVNARRLVSATPLAEQAHADLIRLYWLASRPDEALTQFDACARSLADDLGVEPGPELQGLRDRILAQRKQEAATSATVDTSLIEDETLVGRKEERRQLLDAVDSAFAGTGVFALVEGQAGMGKTRLLADVAEAARWRGAAVLWSRHHDRRGEPYGDLTTALAQVLQGVRREQLLARLDPAFLGLAVQLIPGLGDPALTPTTTEDWASPEERWQFQEALAQVLLTLGRIEPVTLVLDDMHDLDSETVEFLRLTAPRLASSQVTVILAFRSQEARNRAETWELITDLEHRHQASRITLGGLHRTELATLAQTRSGRAFSDDVIDELSRSTGGNPLFIIETLRSMDRAGLDDGDTGVIDREFGGRPTVERVVEVLVREIDAAPAMVQRVVGALAVWGAPADSATIARLLDDDVSATVDAIRAGIDAEFVVESDGDYSLRFEQLTQAALSRLPDRKAMHLRAADHLAEDPLAPAARLADHYALAERWLEASRFEAAAAARAASLHSYAKAAEYYERSLESHRRCGQQPSTGLLFGYELVLDTLGDRDQQADILDMLGEHSGSSTKNRIRALQRRANFLASTDQMSDAVQAASAAVGFAVAAKLDATPCVVTLATTLVTAGHPDLARRHLEGLVGPESRGTARGQAHLALGLALTDVQEYATAATQLDLALEVFREQNDTRGQVEALAAVAVLHSQAGNPSTALASYHDAIGLARQIGHRFGEGMSLANLGLLNYIQGDAAAALEHLNEALQVFESIGHRRGEATVLANRAAMLHSVVGDDVEAEREATFARRYFTEIGDERREAQCLDVLAGIRRRKRSFALSRRLIATALDKVRPANDRWMEVQMLRSLAWTESDAGNHPAALEALGNAIDLSIEFGLDMELPFLHALKARTHLALGSSEAAMEAVDSSRQLVAAGSGLQHIAALWRSEVLEELGVSAEAEDELQAAHKHLVELLQPFSEIERDIARSRVAEHRAISEAYTSRFPRTEVVLLAPANNPTSDPFIEVRWTVHHPDDLYIGDKKDRRRHRLLRLHEEAAVMGAHPRLDDLATALQTSLSTVKRDVAALRKAGLLR